MDSKEVENEFVKNTFCQLKVFTNFIKVFFFYPKGALKVFSHTLLSFNFPYNYFPNDKEEIISIIYGKVILYRTFESLLTGGLGMFGVNPGTGNRGRAGPTFC